MALQDQAIEPDNVEEQVVALSAAATATDEDGDTNEGIDDNTVAELNAEMRRQSMLELINHLIDRARGDTNPDALAQLESARTALLSATGIHGIMSALTTASVAISSNLNTQISGSQHAQMMIQALGERTVGSVTTDQAVDYYYQYSGGTIERDRLRTIADFQTIVNPRDDISLAANAPLVVATDSYMTANPDFAAIVDDVVAHPAAADRARQDFAHINDRIAALINDPQTPAGLRDLLIQMNENADVTAGEADTTSRRCAPNGEQTTLVLEQIIRVHGEGGDLAVFEARLTDAIAHDQQEINAVRMDVFYNHVNGEFRDAFLAQYGDINSLRGQQALRSITGQQYSEAYARYIANPDQASDADKALIGAYMTRDLSYNITMANAISRHVARSIEQGLSLDTLAILRSPDASMDAKIDALDGLLLQLGEENPELARLNSGLPRDERRAMVQVMVNALSRDSSYAGGFDELIGDLAEAGAIADDRTRISTVSGIVNSLLMPTNPATNTPYPFNNLPPLQQAQYVNAFREDPDVTREELTATIFTAQSQGVGTVGDLFTVSDLERYMRAGFLDGKGDESLANIISNARAAGDISQEDIDILEALDTTGSILAMWGSANGNLGMEEIKAALSRYNVELRDVNGDNAISAQELAAAFRPVQDRLLAAQDDRYR